MEAVEGQANSGELVSKREQINASQTGLELSPVSSPNAIMAKRRLPALEMPTSVSSQFLWTTPTTLLSNNIINRWLWRKKKWHKLPNHSPKSRRCRYLRTGPLRSILCFCPGWASRGQQWDFMFFNTHTHTLECALISCSVWIMKPVINVSWSEGVAAVLR